MAIKQIPLTEIVDNPFQPRTTFDKAALQSLADEIKAEGYFGGMLQGRRRNGKVELVYGHRRLRALRLLNMASIQIEIVDLTDAQMALRSLEENLQREGLTDLDKADAIKRVVQILREERKAAGKPERGAIQMVADRLGLDHGWISTQCDISVSMDTKQRKPVEAGYITAKTAHAAKQWGGEVYVDTLAKQGKQAKSDGSVSKPTHMTVSAMKKTVKDAPEPVREALQRAIWTGKVTTPKEATTFANRTAAAKVRHEKEPPPDLKAVIVGWTHRLTEWEQQMRDVVPYMDYVDEAPVTARNFRDALRKLIKTAERLL